MAIIVKALDKKYTVEIQHEKEKLTFIFNQLDYRTKSLISSITTDVKQGQYISDSTMQIFYNLKYGLKEVKGLTSEDGKPYKLTFEDDAKKALTEICVDELLATPISNELQYTAHNLSRSVLPSEILHPLTLTKIEGVDVIPMPGGVKKK